MLEQGLHHRSGLIRKGCALVLQAPKRLARPWAREGDFGLRPPVLANSFPKSGTHLLDQIIGTLPDRRNFGAFLSSMTSSFRFTRRTGAESCRFLQATLPGEIVRAHLFYDDGVAAQLKSLRFAHYFIYRDLRDVVLSESLYYRDINRWHRLHPMFSQGTVADAIMLAIKGIPDPSGRIYYPDVGARFKHYEPWIGSTDAFSVRFEDLISENRLATVASMVEHYQTQTGVSLDVDEVSRRAIESISPAKSHTFRKGKQGTWREAFNAEHCAALKEVAGDILVRHKYEQDDRW